MHTPTFAATWPSAPRLFPTSTPALTHSGTSLAPPLTPLIQSQRQPGQMLLLPGRFKFACTLILVKLKNHKQFLCATDQSCTESGPWAGLNYLKTKGGCRLGWEADRWLSCFVSWENSAGACSLTDCWPLPDTTWPPAATSWFTGVRYHSKGLIIKHYVKQQHRKKSVLIKVE